MYLALLGCMCVRVRETNRERERERERESKPHVCLDDVHHYPSPSGQLYVQYMYTAHFVCGYVCVCVCVSWLGGS